MIVDNIRENNPEIRRLALKNKIEYSDKIRNLNKSGEENENLTKDQNPGKSNFFDFSNVQKNFKMVKEDDSENDKKIIDKRHRQKNKNERKNSQKLNMHEKNDEIKNNSYNYEKGKSILNNSDLIENIRNNIRENSKIQVLHKITKTNDLLEKTRKILNIENQMLRINKNMSFNTQNNNQEKNVNSLNELGKQNKYHEYEKKLAISGNDNKNLINTVATGKYHNPIKNEKKKMNVFCSFFRMCFP